MVSTMKQSALRIAGQAVAVTALLGAGVAQAGYAPLDLTPGSPDIVASLISTAYPAGTGSLTYNSFANVVSPAGSSVGDTDGGSIAGSGYNSGALPTGTLQQPGAPLPGGLDTLEFLFTVTGGDAAGTFGSTVGVTLGNSGR